MSFKADLALALTLLEEKGIPRSQREPWIFRQLWRIGVRVRPPLFTGFILGFTADFLLVTTVVAISRWAFLSQSVGTALFKTSAIWGVVAALFVAGTRWYLRDKHAIPSWNSLDEQ